MKKFINKVAEKIFNLTSENYIENDIAAAEWQDPYLRFLSDDQAFSELKTKANNVYQSHLGEIIKLERAGKNKLSEVKSEVLARVNNFTSGASFPAGGFGQLNNPSAGVGLWSSNDFSNYDYRTTPGYTFQEIWTTFYQTSPIAKALIDILTDSIMQDSFENWVELSSKKGREKERHKKVEEFQDFFEEKEVYLTFLAAVRQMFMHGGSALYIDTDDADLSAPLKVRKGQRIAFRLVDKSLMFPAGFQHIYDISKSNFNHPSHWSIIFFAGGRGLPIHESRFIFFVPEELPFFARINQLWWGNSSLLSVRNYINIVDRGFHSTGNQIQQASMAFLKTRIRSKAANPSVIGRGTQTKNSQFQNALRQNGNANILDKDDEIVRLEVSNLKQQVEVAEKIVNFCCASQTIPPSVFYGSGAGGNHASDPELLNWNMKRKSNQSKFLRRPLNRIFYILNMSLFGDPEAVSFKFQPLMQPSEAQKTDNQLKLSQKYAISKKMGVPNNLIVKQMQRDKLFEDLTLEEVEPTISAMNLFDKKMMAASGPSMEGKDIKDGLNKSNKPSEAMKGTEPESIVSQALYK